MSKGTIIIVALAAFAAVALISPLWNSTAGTYMAALKVNP